MVLARELVANPQTFLAWQEQHSKKTIKRRHDWEIECEIIDAIRDQVNSKSGLMRRCNLPYTKLQEFLVKMHRSGFIVIQEIEGETGARWLIGTTEKARNWRLMVKTIEEAAPK